VSVACCRVQVSATSLLLVRRSPTKNFMVWDSAVGIGTRHGLDGPGIECRWRRDFPHRSWSPASVPYNGYRVIRRSKAAGAWNWPPKPSRVVVKESVELYLYYLRVFTCFSTNCKSLHYFRRVSPALLPRGTVGLTLNDFPCNIILSIFTKVCRPKLIVKIRQN
jgi:hypothetical protein